MVAGVRLAPLQALTVAASLLAVSICGAENAPDSDLGPVGPPVEASAPAVPPNARIGEIRLDGQPIFDTSIPAENNWLFRTANRLHIQTRPKIIERQLLFDEGDAYDPRLLEESERLLRSNRYLYDARVKAVERDDGLVDVDVVTRDVWTTHPTISFGRKGGENKSSYGVEETNLFGRGMRLSLEKKSDVDRDETVFDFRDPHVRGSRGTLGLQWADASDGERYGINVERPFYALDTRRAAGVFGLRNNRVTPLYDRGEQVDEFEQNQDYASAYFGWSSGLRGNWARRWTAGFTYDRNDFADTPESNLTLVRPTDRKLAYPWIGFELVEDNFRKTVNRDQIGRTEDFFLGTQFDAQLGWSSDAFGGEGDSLIYSASWSKGFEPGARSTVLTSLGISGRYEDGGAANLLASASARYYLQQTENLLFFSTVNVDKGRALDIDNQLLLGGDNGLRGYPLRYQSGDTRAWLTVEQRYFTDWYPFRLIRVGGAVFADVGRTWGDNPTDAKNLGTLTDLGFGLRLGSTRSGRGKVIHIDVAFPLNGDDSVSSVEFTIDAKERF